MYRIFLYKTRGVSVDAPCILSTNRTLDVNTLDAWEEHCTEEYMQNFDIQKVKAELENLIGDDNGSFDYIHIKSSPWKKIEYICVIAPYEKIKMIVSALYSVSVNNDLVLYDSTKNRTFHQKNLYDSDFVKIRDRINTINRNIQTSVKPLFRMRKLGYYDGKRYKYADYVITLKKEKGVPLEKRVEDFYEFLKLLLINGEELVTENRCFTIKGEFYEISYVIEAYKKYADRIGYISDGIPHSELICRMSCERAAEWVKKNITKRFKNYNYCMYVTEMKKAFPNSADRFVKGVNIRKQIKKDKFGYTYCGCYGGGIDFSTFFPNNTYEKREVSNLCINEDDAMPLLRVISKFYPYFSARYYEHNYLPAEMIRDIISEMKRIRELIIHDFDNEDLKPYIENKSEFNWLICDYDKYSEKMFNENWPEFLYNKRYEAVKIYDIFIEWAEKQLDLYDVSGEGLMFSVLGP